MASGRDPRERQTQRTVPSGPVNVPAHLNKFASDSGNADTPGVGVIWI